MARPDDLALVRAELGEKFPAATFTTNDDANPATPMGVTASWANGRILKTVRADSISSSVQDFIAKAVRIIGPFESNAVPTKHKQVA